jgi:hypothetical protein
MVRQYLPVAAQEETMNNWAVVDLVEGALQVLMELRVQCC